MLWFAIFQALVPKDVWPFDFMSSFDLRELAIMVLSVNKRDHILASSLVTFSLPSSVASSCSSWSMQSANGCNEEDVVEMF